MPTKKTRIKDIAEKAGVSIGTIDRVLHNRGEVKAETREKVLKIAKQMNYQPNIAARALKSPTSYKIAVMIPQSSGNNHFWNMHPLGIEQALETVAPFIVKVNYFNYEMHSAMDFMKNASQLVEWKPDGVILAPILKNETLELCHKLDDMNIPYAFIDTNIQNTNALTFIGEDGRKGGRVAASIMDVGVDTEKDILIVNIAKDLDNVIHLNLRNQGFMSYFMDSGKNKGLKISVEVPSGDKKGIYSKLDTVFNNNKNIGGIMVSSARTFVIAEYLKDRKLEDKFLIGYEVFEKNAQYLEDGIIDFLISQRPIDQAEKTFKRLFSYLVHHTVPEKMEFQPIDIINRENLFI
ncbi:LacI family DNA-binding transcriptional regulator [Plebeiibacterium marinum]|uniref:LacI family DNA-binding transcriptional regulator n=1 Tax=Plebeiibacterium marinum TaxID=2992111 RepID=A0AAE3MC98_9BACT|nr:LacI family DNA-binding transcriptional regulator [Plebeiobacterium marinum]MCW3804899.1 LacI family DNA-binding transcriptional regulator [Plebeiobacterium marinum]